MRTGKKNILLRFTAFSVTAVYLFITAFHLFLAPRFRHDHFVTSAANVKQDTYVIYTLIKTNRCMVNNNKVNDVIVKQHSLFFISLFSYAIVSPAAQVNYQYQSAAAINLQSSYLCNRVLRI